MLWLYDERYHCYKKAYDKLKNPPAELLLLLSNCKNTPGTPPITAEESEFYLKKAVEKKMTSETALAMRSFYRVKGNKAQEKYWNQKYQELEKKGVFCDQIIPDVLQNSKDKLNNPLS